VDRAAGVDDAGARLAVVAQGIASLTAGPVSVAFRGPIAGEPPLERQRLPDAAWDSLVPSWYQTLVSAAGQFLFDALGGACGRRDPWTSEW
jgi:hypothetical protein